MDTKTILLTLKYIDKIGNVTAKRVMDTILQKEVTLDKLFSILQNTPRIKITDFNVVKDAHVKAQELLDRLINSDIKMITYLNPDYPKSFLSINDPPVFLFYSGDLKILSKNCVAIVGTRKPSETGKNIANKLATKLCIDHVIVSGLAEGIDTEAHKATIKHKGQTIAILGHGLDIIFPPKNKDLAEEIIETGGLIISEYPLGQTYTKYNFLARDRLQSALSEKVFIIETNEDGGTMETAKKANEYSKEVFVFKSKSPDYALPSGNLMLINQGAKTFSEDFLVD